MVAISTSDFQGLRDMGSQVDPVWLFCFFFLGPIGSDPSLDSGFEVQSFVFGTGIEQISPLCTLSGVCRHAPVGEGASIPCSCSHSAISQIT
jgi:hypothetical protein